MKAQSIGRMVAVLLLGLAGFATPAALAQNPDLDFTVENQTGFTFNELYLSPAQKETWGKQVLSSPLKDGQSRGIRFKPTAKSTVWDMRVVYADGKAVYWKGLDLTKFNRLVLKWDKSTGKTSVQKKKA
jgi:hypothetical protein